MKLDLKQFPDDLPNNILVSAHSNCGKTTFCAYVAKQFLKAGLKVAMVDSDHSIYHKVYCNQLVEVFQAFPDAVFNYIPTQDLDPVSKTRVLGSVGPLLAQYDLVIIDSLHRACQTPPNGLQSVVDALCRQNNSKSTLLMTWQLPKVWPVEGEKLLSSGIDVTKNDPVPFGNNNIFPILLGNGNPMKIEVRRLT